MNDYSGVNTGLNQQTKLVDTTSSVFMPISPNRIGLVVNAPVANFLTLSFSNPAVSGRGIVLFAGDPPFQLYRRFWGSAIQGEITAIMDTAGEQITFVEIVAGV